MEGGSGDHSPRIWNQWDCLWTPERWAQPFDPEGHFHVHQAGVLVATIGVVIADDHHEVRQSIRQLLERTDGFAVVGEAVDGVQAVAEAGRLLPDLVIMDVFMPEMGGLEATRQIVKKWPLVKVVALTADPTMVMDALTAGATGCLLKGDPAPALVAVLRNVVSGARSGCFAFSG
jgi:DNA-binding NarL/FixJ family response regulator